MVNNPNPQSRLTFAVKLFVLGLVVSITATAFSDKWRLRLQQRLGLVVQEVSVVGRRETNIGKLAQLLPLGTPLFSFSPKRIKSQLEELAWVRRAAVRRQLNGNIRIRLLEKRPYARWQGEADGETVLIAEDGAVIGVEQAKDFPHLTLIKGDEARRYGPEFLKSLSPPNGHGIKSVSLQGIDHWSVELANGILILLPQEEPLTAWRKLVEFNRNNHLLERNLKTVDMRVADRLVVSPRSAKATKAAKGGSGKGKVSNRKMAKGKAM